MRRSIEFPVGICDGNVIHYEYTCNGLVVQVSLWNGTSLLITFLVTYFVEDIGAVGNPNEIEGDLQEFCECSMDEATPAIVNKLKQSGANDDEIQRLRMFHLSDGFGGSSLKVICETIDIKWIDQSGEKRSVAWD